MGDPVGIHESMLPGCHCCLLDNPGLLCWPLVEARVVHRVFCEHLGAIKEASGNRRSPVHHCDSVARSNQRDHRKHRHAHGS